MFTTSTAENVAISESHSQILLRGFFEKAGLESWPITPDQAADLLAAMDYDVDAEELRRLQSLGQVPDVAIFDARDIVVTAGALDGRRQWRIGPSAHDQHKTEWRRKLEELLVDLTPENVATIRRAYKGFDVRLALLLMCESDDRNTREKCLTMVQGLLAIEDTVSI
jgi:hypothetical protein